MKRVSKTSLPLWIALSISFWPHAAHSQGRYQTDADVFRSSRAQSLTASDGWLSLVGLEWLKPGVNSLGSAANNTVHLPAGAPAHLAVIEQTGAVPNESLNIAPPYGGYPAGFTVNGRNASQGLLQQDAKLGVGTFTFLILERGNRLGLRIKDTNASTRVHFTGLKWYPADETYRINAKWVPYATEHTEDIATIVGTTLHEKVPGYAEFVLNGQVLRLEPVVEGKRLFFIVRDKTSLTTTYGASRFLYTDLPSSGLTHDGEVVLDFNKLVNPPCAYTNYATCPLPPAQNRLNIAIPAGEKRYRVE